MRNPDGTYSDMHVCCEPRISTLSVREEFKIVKMHSKSKPRLITDFYRIDTLLIRFLSCTGKI